jgi:hypothetical protein
MLSGMDWGREDMAMEPAISSGLDESRAPEKPPFIGKVELTGLLPKAEVLTWRRLSPFLKLVKAPNDILSPEGEIPSVDGLRYALCPAAPAEDGIPAERGSVK